MRKFLTYEHVKENIESIDGYILLSKKYKTSHAKLDIKCPKNHIFKVTFANFHHNKSRCPICSGKQKHTYDFIKEQIEKEGYELLSDKYIKNNNKLLLKCPKNHTIEMSYLHFNLGQRCSVCNSGVKLDIKQIKKRINIEGYELLSNKYINAYSKLKIKCPKNHTIEMSYSNFHHNKRRCAICNNNGTSIPEKEIQNYIKSFNIKQINNDRNTILNKATNCYLELDVYLPDQNKAIEFNGKHWHSSDDAIRRDKIKADECKRLGIDLLIINERDYINNKQEELNKIQKFIGF